MLRLVVIHLFQWFKRLSSTLLTRGSNETSYSRHFTGQEEDEGRWTFVALAIVFTLSLYCLAGLGYYAKVHVWDGFTLEQQENIARVMIASSQNL